jgi:hypothetical protein
MLPSRNDATTKSPATIVNGRGFSGFFQINNPMIAKLLPSKNRRKIVI